MPIHDMRKHMKGACVLASVIKICVIPLNLVLAKTLARAVTGATQGDIDAVIVQAIWTFVLALSLMAIQIGGQIALQRRAAKLLNRCKLGFLNEVLSNPLPRLFSTDHGELLENLNDDIDSSFNRYIKLWPTMLAGILTAVVYVVYLLLQSPLVAATLLGISLLQLAPPVIVKKYMQINYNDCREIESKITDQVVEAVTGFEVIKIYGLKSWWQRRMAALHKDYVVVGNKSEATATAQIPMGKLLDNILKYGTYAVLGIYAMFGVCSMETALLGIAMSPSLYVAVNLLFSAIPDIGVASTADKRLAKWQCQQKRAGTAPKNGDVSLRNVSFSYGDNVVFNGVTYHFEANKTYLLEGENGAGKSTLINLLAGMLLPGNGDVLIGNVAPVDFADSVYPCDVLFIPQHDPEFDITPVELFEMFDKRYMSALVQTAARLDLQPARMKSCAIRELSGGERKKVFLAIAFVLNPRVLLLDEPTNSIDAQAQAVLNSLISERAGTTFIISHDPQCRAVADEILNIANGGIKYAAI